jgi:hypothetical protein
MLASMTRKLSTRLAAATIFLALVVAGCGSTTSNPSPAAARPGTPSAQMTQQAQPNPSTTQNQNQAATTAGPTTAQSAPSPAASAGGPTGIPQGNGGDQDADNNGGPSDGDGKI